MINLKFDNIKDELKKLNPLIHCITNPISINECANALLSLGTRPIMAQHPLEVAEITKTANSVLFNLGNITDDRMKAIEISVKTANKFSIPSVLDLVGISCSNLRRSFAYGLTQNTEFSVIKGNYSEIKALFDNEYRSIGVDADAALDTQSITKLAQSLALKHKTVIMASGKIDIITDGTKTAYIKNGTSDLSKITGTGCILGAICSAFMSIVKPFDASVYSCAYLGICGELADSNRGYGTYFLNLMDNISMLTDSDIEKHINMEMVKNA